MKLTCDFSFTSAPHRPRGPWNATALFRAGKPGAWFDPSDLATLFQDSAGTLPVTAPGQPVGLMLDKSGRGKHATQANVAARPTYQESGGLRYLVFDGVDDFMVTSAIDFTSTNKMTVFAGVRKQSDAARGMVVEINAATGRVGIEAPESATPSFAMYSQGTVQSYAKQMAGYAAPISAVVTAIGDIGGDAAKLRINGIQAVQSLSDQGTGNYSNAAVYIGRRGGSSLPFNGNIYGLIMRGAASSAAEIAQAERWLAGKTGVVLQA
jgi:hypothetical protein